MKKFLTFIALFAMTLGVAAQTFYEWKDGKYTARSISEIDSITFSLPNVKTIPDNAVDLGLPSGTLWADRNVGADTPEGYGDYYAWGETTPKSLYNWSSYKWCNGSETTMTKYCTNSSYGTVDNKTVLDAEDDAATANWGNEWRMPTYAEYAELDAECTWAWTTQNGVKGYKVTGPNGNSIFLPAAGYSCSDNVNYVGSNGSYWSSSLVEDGRSHIAYYISLGSFDHFIYYTSRGDGRSVRAVVK